MLAKSRIIWYNIYVCGTLRREIIFSQATSRGKACKIVKSKQKYAQKTSEMPDPIFQLTSVASANDCTGITVTVPEDEFEANSIAHLEPVNVTSKKSI